MRKNSREWVSPRSRKRKTEMESNKTVEPKVKRTLVPQVSDNPDVDKCCWICHIEGYDLPCKTCARVFHDSCLTENSLQFSELRVCPECQLLSMDGTELNSRYLSPDKLKMMLSTVIHRSLGGKKRNKTEKFVRWPESNRSKLGKIIDIEILLDYVNKGTYTKTTEFYSDVKYIHHNACIVFGVNSEEAKAAEQLGRDCKKALLDIEKCPECYYYLYTSGTGSGDPFVRLCDSPHDIVWAQLTGHPYWPAKCLKVIKNVAYVQFFGEHEQSNIPTSKCYFMSKNHPSKSEPKSQRYKDAKAELLVYIELYEKRYREFPYQDPKKLYKPVEKLKKVVIASTRGNEDLVAMKPEGLVTEDPESNSPESVEPVEDNPNSSIINCSNSPLPEPTVIDNESQFTSLNEINPAPLYTPSDDDPMDLLNQMHFNSDGIHVPGFPNQSIQDSQADEYTFLSNRDSATKPRSTNSGNQPLSNFFPDIYNNLEFKDPDSGHQETNHNVLIGSVSTSQAVDGASHNVVIQTDTVDGIENGLVHNTGNQSQLADDEVTVIQELNARDTKSIDPAVIMPILTKDPEMKGFFENAAQMFTALLVKLSVKNPSFVGMLSSLSSMQKKLTAEYEKLQSDYRKLHLELQKSQESLKALETENMELNLSFKKEEELKMETATNAQLVVSGLRSKYLKKIEVKLKEEFKVMETCLHEKEEQILKLEGIVKNLEEEKNQLQSELESIKAKQQNEENSARLLVSSDAIREYKITHYCCVCEKSAGFVCCLNASYCSPACQAKHSEQHSKHCDRKKSVVHTQQTQIEYLRVIEKQNITSGTSSVDNPSSSICHSQSMSYAMHHKKEQIHQIAASSLQPTPQDGHPSSSYPLKKKLRSNK